MAGQKVARAEDTEAPVELCHLNTSDQCRSRGAMPAVSQRAELYYAEFDPHAGPEVVSGEEGNGRTNASAVGEPVSFTRDRNTDLPTQLVGSPSAGNNGLPHNITRGHMPKKRCKACLYQPWLWVQRKPYLAAAAAAFVFGVLALVTLPIVLHHMSADESGAASGNVTSSATALPAKCSSCSPPAPSTSVTPPGTALNVTQCLHNAIWASNVSYMGVAESAGKTWPYKLLAAPDAFDCCTTCFAEFPLGCQGWSFLPWDNTPAPCTIVYGWNATSGISAACPNGKAQITFATDSSRSGSVGDIGPCGYAAV